MFDNCTMKNTSITVEYNGRRIDSMLYHEVRKKEMQEFVEEQFKVFEDIADFNQLVSDAFLEIASTILPDNKNVVPMRFKLQVEVKLLYDEETF